VEGLKCQDGKGLMDKGNFEDLPVLLGYPGQENVLEAKVAHAAVLEDDAVVTVGPVVSSNWPWSLTCSCA